MDFQSFAAKDLKTCPEKIVDKSYHHRRKLRPILEDGNVNKVSFEIIFKRSESLCLVLKTLKMNKNLYLILLSSICLQYYLNFCFDLGTSANSCTTQLLSKSYEIPVVPNYPTLQNNRNKIYRIAKKLRKTFSTFPND